MGILGRYDVGIRRVLSFRLGDLGVPRVPAGIRLRERAGLDQPAGRAARLARLRRLALRRPDARGAGGCARDTVGDLSVRGFSRGCMTR